MRHISITVLVVAVVAACSFLTLGRATSQDVSCGQTAKELESKLSKITQDLDKTAFEQFVADDVVIINATGETRGKKQQTAAFTLPSNLTFSFTTADVKTRICGQTSIVTTGKDIVTFKEEGKNEPEAQSYWFTRIYEKRRGRWQLVFNQLTSTNE